MSKVLAVINFLGSGHANNDLPGGPPDHPSNSLPGHGHPDHDLPPWFPKPVTPWPPKVTDPEWGIESGRPHPDHPIFIPITGHPDNSLPSGAPGHPAPPIAVTPPGTIWPPLPVTNPPAPPGNAALLVWLIGVGWRYVIVTIPEPEPK